VKLTFLGTGAGNFRGSRRQPSSALLDTLLLDCGAGATGRLHDLQALDRVEAVLVTHLHSDHVAGLFDFLLHTLIAHRSRPLTVVSPPGLKPILASVFAVHGTVQDPATVYDFRVVEGLAPELTIGEWHVVGVPLDHSVVDLGYRVSTDRLSVFYTGDTREPSATLSARADYLVHESTYADRQREAARAFGHSTAADAARAAHAVGARRLFLTHVGNAADAEAEIASEARAVFAESTLAEDGASFDL
jgi:ribonuclease Z